VVSAQGHNSRLTIPFENLPLPAPALSGPGIVWLPPNATSVTVPANAAVPFTLHVDDAVVHANIDDTTKWKFQSSNAADTMPAVIQQTDGSVNFAVTFGSTGARTLTVTSVGDATVIATLNVIVENDGIFLNGFGP
ncbi:MAG TPA: hypothetical protein VGG61_12765, partial [Gemmataceae bacterium]